MKELLVKQIMQVKDRLLKKNKSRKAIILVFFVLFSNSVLGEEGLNENIIRYLNSIENFSASFLQSDDQTIEEGKLFIGKTRARVEYNNPSKIVLILAEKKAMYYNYDLDEVEFFNPRNTSAWFFYEIFKNPLSLKGSEIIIEDSVIEVLKSGNHQDQNYKLKIIFENNPLLIRKIYLEFEDIKITVSMYDHKMGESFGRNFFRLIPPKTVN